MRKLRALIVAALLATVACGNGGGGGQPAAGLAPVLVESSRTR